MGIIDTATITMTCPSCGATEASRIRDKGNGYSGSAWESPKFEQFETSISGSAKTDYTVTGTCPTCHVAAQVTHDYNT